MFQPTSHDWPQIQGKDLEPADIGRIVCYHSLVGPAETGKLSSYRPDGSIFVRFRAAASQRCDGRSLTWHPPTTTERP